MPPRSRTDQGAESTSTDAAPTEGDTPKAPAQSTTEAVAAAQSEQEITMATPSFWMRSVRTGEFFPAFGLDGRQNLEAVGCERVAEGPPDQPAAIGIPELGIAP